MGQLKELRALQRTRYEDAVGANIVADLLWSDPCARTGITANERRSMSITYGPDASAAFLKAHRLLMMLRSHEGPDARDQRHGEMPDVDAGYSIDHRWPDSNEPSVVTVFSAPAYPQFKSSKKQEAARNTLGAYAVLTPREIAAEEASSSSSSSPNKTSSGVNVKWDIDFVQYEAAPRPPGIKYPHL